MKSTHCIDKYNVFLLQFVHPLKSIKGQEDRLQSSSSEASSSISGDALKNSTRRSKISIFNPPLPHRDIQTDDNMGNIHPWDTFHGILGISPDPLEFKTGVPMGDSSCLL
ncbi:hypothetical protein NPIL_499051 [Nephila pilipes]|uniref:Uncharacterized protein n=1 Tax=Nephila pilipes TaxID=299642 RepID=A0A8X6U4N0_NEPPI|nr:hypothetical protein NPIL_499051 [Nephila pilipes]